MQFYPFRYFEIRSVAQSVGIVVVLVSKVTQECFTVSLVTKKILKIVENWSYMDCKQQFYMPEKETGNDASLPSNSVLIELRHSCERSHKSSMLSLIRKTVPRNSPFLIVPDL